MTICVQIPPTTDRAIRIRQMSVSCVQGHSHSTSHEPASRPVTFTALHEARRSACAASSGNARHERRTMGASESVICMRVCERHEIGLLARLISGQDSPTSSRFQLGGRCLSCE